MRKPVKITIQILGTAMLAAVLCNAGCARKQSALWQSIKNPEVTARLKTFVAEKEAQAQAAARAEGKEIPPEYQALFAAAAKGDWPAVKSTFDALSRYAPQYDHWSTNGDRLTGTQWAAGLETYGALEAFASGGDRYCVAFTRDIINSIPPGSIYFGGTDPGRFLVTALCQSQVNADPFFVLTQNMLTEGGYLACLRSMYGDQIYIPTAEDSQKCFEDYSAAVQRRGEQHQLKPGENYKMVDGKPQISGSLAFTQIDGLLAKVIFDKNPDREFYVEESFPFDWMYPCLEPHGLIFKISRQPLPALSDEILERDHDYWAKLVQPLIGDWLNDDTPVGEIAAFAKKTFGKQDFSGFTGDPGFIQNAYVHRTFSKERSSIAGLYAWRLKPAAGAAEKERMTREADFAFRQAWALCPYSPEAVFRYVNYLLEQKRFADALLVAETAAQMPALRGKDGDPVRNLVEQLKKFPKRK